MCITIRKGLCHRQSLDQRDLYCWADFAVIVPIVAVAAVAQSLAVAVVHRRVAHSLVVAVAHKKVGRSSFGAVVHKKAAQNLFVVAEGTTNSMKVVRPKKAPGTYSLALVAGVERC